MSKQMKNFSDYFMQGLQLGAGWAEKWQAGQIAKARNAIMQERNAAVDKRENAKLGLYAEQVRANAELARARAANVGKTKGGGGGGGGGATANPGLDALTTRWAARDAAANRSGAMPQPAAPPPQQNITVMGGGDGSGGDVTDAAAPVEGGYGDSGNDTLAKGGMVRPKNYAEGGIVEGMSLEEAKSYEGAPSSPEPKAKPAAGGGGVLGALGGAFAKGAATPAPAKAKPAAIDLTGTGETYRRGGTVRKFQSGGRVMEAIDTGTSGPGSGYGYRAAPPARSY